MNQHYVHHCMVTIEEDSTIRMLHEQKGRTECWNYRGAVHGCEGLLKVITKPSCE